MVPVPMDINMCSTQMGYFTQCYPGIIKFDWKSEPCNLGWDLGEASFIATCQQVNRVMMIYRLDLRLLIVLVPAGSIECNINIPFNVLS